jgi:hypothetical protein
MLTVRRAMVSWKGLSRMSTLEALSEDCAVLR